MKTETLWDWLSKNWDSSSTDLGESDQKIVDKTSKLITPTDTLLDYGCASGTIALELAAKVQQVHGIDISSKMITIAERRTKERQLSNVTFSHADIFDPEHKDGSYDVITAFALLHLLDDPWKAVQKIHQLLKPGGLFITSTPCLGEKNFISLLLNTFVFIASRIGLLPRSISFFSQAKLKDSLISENFEITETEVFSTRPVTEIFIVAKKR